MSFFEAGMLVCFGASWPAALYKSFKSRSTGGKSLLFIILVLAGYLCGIAHKAFYSPDFVIYLYILNTCMVAADLALYFRNRRLERQKEALP